MKYEIQATHPLRPRNRLIELLNRELACEYQAVIAYILYSEVLRRACYPSIAAELERQAADGFQHAKGISQQISDLGGTPCTLIGAVNPAADPATPCSSEVTSEPPGAGCFRYPLHALGAAVGDADFRTALRAIIVHGNDIILAAALGTGEPPPTLPRATRSATRRNFPSRRKAGAAPRNHRRARRNTARTVEQAT